MLRQLQLDGQGFKLLHPLIAERWPKCIQRVISTGRVACVSAASPPVKQSISQQGSIYKLKSSQNLAHSLAGQLSKYSAPNKGWTPVLKRSFASDSSNQGTGGKEVVPFNLSDIGEGIAEVLVKEWYVEIGQRVNQFDSICEVQSDKASVTITSKFDGIIKKIYHSVDEVAKVGEPLVDIEIDVQSTWTSNQLIDEIDDQDACERSSSSSTSSDERVASSSPEHFVFSSSSRATSNLDSYKKTLATPAVRRLAMQNAINLSDVHGTGKDGRVMKEDLLLHIERLQAAASSTKAIDKAASPPRIERSVTAAASATSSATTHRGEAKHNETVKLSPVTRGMMKSMTASLSIPHLALADEVNMVNLIKMKQLIEKMNAPSSSPPVKITYLPIMMKALSLSLTQYPILNSTLSESRDEITHIASHNIGFAMDTPVGLLVPNVKSVEQLSIQEIAREINRLMDAGSRGSLSPDDLTGGTFTLSNIGSIGGTFGIPVILSPQVAIGAIGAIQSVPRFKSPSSDEIYRASIMQVVWTADHRIIDGATVAKFSSHWRKLLEEPISMLIDLK